MAWFRKNNLPNIEQGSSKLTYLRPEPSGCQDDGHFHHEWLPSESEFEDDVVTLWGDASVEAQIALGELAQTNNHIGYSSAAVRYFLSLTRPEAAWLHSNLVSSGVEFTDEIREQLEVLGEIETLEIYEVLADLAEVSAEDELESKHKRSSLFILLASSFMEGIYWDAKFFNDEDFMELTELLERYQGLVNLFPVGSHLPCDEPAEDLKSVVIADLEDIYFEGGQPNLKPDGLTNQLAIGTKYVLPNGQHIDAQSDRDIWLEVRRKCVGATDARKLVKLNGEVSAQRETLLREKIYDITHYFESFELGVEREPIIAAMVAKEFPEEQFAPNSFLYVGANDRHVATPDMVGSESLCEIKVSTKPLKACKTTYRDQLQWQMHVTGASHVLLAVENRHSQELETEWIPRDEARILTLVAAADSFLEDLDEWQARRDERANQNSFDDSEEDEDEDELEDLEDDIDLEESETPLVVRELPTYELLSWDYTQAALKMYCQGRDVFVIADNLGKTSNDVVATLGIHIFGLEGELVDASAEKWGHGWDSESKATMATFVRSGKNIDEICETLGRDRLGVLYRIFAGLNPVVPPRVMKAFKVEL